MIHLLLFLASYPHGDGEGTDTQVIEPFEIIKTYRNVPIKELTNCVTWQIETEEDVDKYVAALQQKLKSKLEKDTVINVEF